MLQISFSHARAHLAETLASVANSNEPALISRRGQRTAVLMSLEQFERLSNSSGDFATRLRTWRSACGKQAHGDASDDPWADVRDRTPGRTFAW